MGNTEAILVCPSCGNVNNETCVICTGTIEQISRYLAEKSLRLWRVQDLEALFNPILSYKLVQIGAVIVNLCENEKNENLHNQGPSG